MMARSLPHSLAFFRSGASGTRRCAGISAVGGAWSTWRARRAGRSRGNGRGSAAGSSRTTPRTRPARSTARRGRNRSSSRSTARANGPPPCWRTAGAGASRPCANSPTRTRWACSTARSRSSSATAFTRTNGRSWGSPRWASRALPNEVRRLIRFENGAFRLALEFFSFQYADKGAWYGPRFQELFGPPRRPDEPVESERFADLAASFQLVTEEIGLALVRHLLKLGRGLPQAVSGGRRGAQRGAQRQDPRRNGRGGTFRAAGGVGLGRGAGRGAAPPPHAARRAACAGVARRVPRTGLRRRRHRRGLRRGKPRLRTGGRPGGTRRRAAGGGQGRRMVPGTDGVWSPRPGQPLDPGRPAPRRHEGHPQRQGQVPRGVPALRPGGARGTRGRVLRGGRRAVGSRS